MIDFLLGFILGFVLQAAVFFFAMDYPWGKKKKKVPEWHQEINSLNLHFEELRRDLNQQEAEVNNNFHKIGHTIADEKLNFAAFQQGYADRQYKLSNSLGDDFREVNSVLISLEDRVLKLEGKKQSGKGKKA